MGVFQLEAEKRVASQAVLHEVGEVEDFAVRATVVCSALLAFSTREHCESTAGARTLGDNLEFCQRVVPFILLIVAGTIGV